MAELAKVGDSDFAEKVLKADGPVLVDFFGSWCAPCVKMKPMLEEIAEEHSGKLTVVQVEVSEAPDTAGRYDVMGVPTLVIFSSGEPKETLAGTISKADILKALEPHLGASL